MTMGDIDDFNLQDRQEQDEPDETSFDNVLFLLGVSSPDMEEVVAEIPESESDELQEVFLGIDLDERLSEIRGYLRTREDTKSDALHVEKLAKIWGMNEDAIIELFADRDFSIREIEELLYYTLRLKDEALGPDQPLSPDNLAEVSSAFSQTQIREDLKERTKASLTSTLGMDAVEIDIALGFDEKDTEERMRLMTQKEKKLAFALMRNAQDVEKGIRALYFIGWLADQSFMGEYGEKIKAVFSMGNRLDVGSLINGAMSEIDSQAFMMMASRRQSHKKGLSFKIEESIKKFNRLVAAKRMCELLGMGKYRPVKSRMD